MLKCNTQMILIPKIVENILLLLLRMATRLISYTVSPHLAIAQAVVLSTAAIIILLLPETVSDMHTRITFALTRFLAGTGSNMFH
jgi:hypothetical protein